LCAAMRANTPDLQKLEQFWAGQVGWRRPPTGRHH
jgi:hypothetical protein